MKKLTLISILLFSFFVNYSQQAILLFKKKNQNLESFWVGSTIAFQLRDKQWQKGEITKIQNDSFFIRPVVVRYNLLNTDTFYYNIAGYSVSDIYAMPKKGVLIDYKDGEFQISMSGGHQHWYWIKSGWIFRVAARRLCRTYSCKQSYRQRSFHFRQQNTAWCCRRRFPGRGCVEKSL